jgi:hypothetical protein
MSGIFSAVRNYEFLNLTESVTKAQMAVYKKPAQTWTQIGSKFYNICWYNGEAIAAVGLDVAAYLAISTLRACGLFCPLPPAPPTFPTPLDNAAFVNYAIERALWNWDYTPRKELEEGIADSYSDKWNVFQVVGEVSLAYSLENSQKSSYYKPTFLTISEPLENGESFRSVGVAFDRLWQKDKTAILDAIYSQKEPASLSSAGKKVYQTIRALASKLHQGNTIFLNAYKEYVKQRALKTPSITAPRAIVPKTLPQPQAETLAPSVYHSPTRVFPSLFSAHEGEGLRPTAALADHTRASAPPLGSNFLTSNELEMIANVQFLNGALKNAVGALDPHRQRKFVQLVVNDSMRPLGSSYNTETLSYRTPEISPKFFVARLAMLRLLKDGFQKGKVSDCPHFFPWNTPLRNGNTLRAVGLGFGSLSDREFAQLQEAIVDPTRAKYVLDDVLKQKLFDLSEFAERLQVNEDFLKTYEALRIDLLAK